MCRVGGGVCGYGCCVGMCSQQVDLMMIEECFDS